MRSSLYLRSGSGSGSTSEDGLPRAVDLLPVPRANDRLIFAAAAKNNSSNNKAQDTQRVSFRFELTSVLAASMMSDSAAPPSLARSAIGFALGTCLRSVRHFDRGRSSIECTQRRMKRTRGTNSQAGAIISGLRANSFSQPTRF